MDSATTTQNRYCTVLSWALLALCVLFPVIILSTHVKIPIGAFYWDSYLYLDAQNRIANGQIPHIDFFPPVGALGYYLFYWLRLMLPDSQPMLAASWSITLVSTALMAIVLWDALKKNTNKIAILLVVMGFAFFTIVPFNTTEYSSFPGFDGFAIYNRHGSQLIYIVAAALLFMRSTWVKGLVIGLAMTALFSLKITAFLAAGLLCAYGLFSGKISLASTLIAIVTAALLLAKAEFTTGIVSVYISDIIVLVASNKGDLAVRLLQGASRTFGIAAPATLTALVLLFTHKWERFDHPFMWIFATVVAGIFFESQNTGGQELIFIIPVMVYAMTKVFATDTNPNPIKLYALMLLSAATVLPPVVQTLQHATRATFVILNQQPLEHKHLKDMGDVLVRPFLSERTTEMRQHWLQYPNAMRNYTKLSQLPEFVLFQDFAFQELWAKNADEVVGALLQREKDGLNFTTVMNIDFTSPFAYLLGKQAPKHMAIGADPSRIVKSLTDEQAAALADTDILLIPQCPYTHNVKVLEDIYKPALGNHTEVKVSPCYTALIHPRIQAQWQ